MQPNLLHAIFTASLLRHIASAVFLSLYLTPAHANPEQTHDSPHVSQSQYSTSSESIQHVPPTINEKFCRVPNGYDLPELHQVKRSDWVNVKTDVNPGAIGDGLTDDTPAIQAALNKIGSHPGTPKVVYLPPGSYRITETLTLKQRNGGMIIGHGISTRLIWDGESGGRMFWSNGAARQSYIGMVWDGAGKAGVGIDHDSKTFYETRVLHEHMEFRNFETAGIRVGHDQKLASAEMLFGNLIFNNNTHGVLIQSWNDYNNVFDGCNFNNNVYGIHAEKGNVVVRNSRFNSSKESDLYLSTHSHSARRVISTNSGRFIQTVRGPVSNGLIRVQDVIVTGWKDTRGAIVSGLRGPLLIFDTTFMDPPGDHAPIKLDNPAMMNQLAVLSNVASHSTSKVADEGHNGRILSAASNRTNGSNLSPEQAFGYIPPSPPGYIFDVKEDCGARGDGVRDDTKHISECIAKAAANGPDSLVYFPSGAYRISRTLEIPTGSGFRVEGTGWHSQIIMSKSSTKPTLRIHDPEGLQIEHLTLSRKNEGTSLLQTGKNAGSVRYHNVFGYHDDQRKNSPIIFDSLPEGTQVLAGHIDGRTQIHNSSEASILIGFLISVQLTVSGESPQTGFLGILSHVSALDDFPLVIKDNQSLTITDWYNEQTRHLVLLEGNGQIEGQVVLDHTKAENTETDSVIINGYHGFLAHTGGMFGNARDHSKRVFNISNTSDFTLLLAANTFWNQPPDITNKPKSTNLVGNTVHRQRKGPLSIVDDHYSPDTTRTIDRALAAYRRLGEMDLHMNYCIEPSQ